jgi:hypothetical protein
MANGRMRPGRAKNSACPWRGCYLSLLRAGFEPFGVAPSKLIGLRARFPNLSQTWLTNTRGSKPARSP